MMNKLYLIRQTARLSCTWVPTGDAKRPLACIWAAAQTPQALNTASPADEAGRMYLCA